MSDLLPRLVAIRGVAEAEIDSTTDPAAIRVKLAGGADRSTVAREVAAVLSSSGYRTRFVPPRRQPVPTQPPAPPPSEPAGRPAPAPTPTMSPAKGVIAVDWVEVREGPAEVTVILSVNGRQAQRRARPTPGGLVDAIAEAVALALGQPLPKVLSFSVESASGKKAVTVVVERHDGLASAGAALVIAGQDLATARAIAEALSS